MVFVPAHVKLQQWRLQNDTKRQVNVDFVPQAGFFKSGLFLIRYLLALHLLFLQIKS